MLNNFELGQKVKMITKSEDGVVKAEWTGTIVPAFHKDGTDRMGGTSFIYSEKLNEKYYIGGKTGDKNHDIYEIVVLLKEDQLQKI